MMCERVVPLKMNALITVHLSSWLRGGRGTWQMLARATGYIVTLLLALYYQVCIQNVRRHWFGYWSSLWRVGQASVTYYWTWSCHSIEQSDRCVDDVLRSPDIYCITSSDQTMAPAGLKHTHDCVQTCDGGCIVGRRRADTLLREVDQWWKESFVKCRCSSAVAWCGKLPPQGLGDPNGLYCLLVK